MRNTISREQPFQVLATNFSIGPSLSGYELEISADGVNYTSLFTVGANVTRMVTGVANGSYYRLAGNTDEDVVVNWQTQCNDGGSGGGGGVGPQGPQGPQGMVGPQGPQGQNGIEQAPTILKSINELPSDAEEGDVVALYAEGEGLPYGIIFEERDDLGENEDMSGGRFSFPIGAFDEIEESDAVYVAKVIAPDDTEHELYIYGNEWNEGGAVLTDIDGGIYISMGVNSDSAGANDTNDMTADYHYTDVADEYMVVDFYPSSTGSVSFDIPQAETEIGVFQYDGNDWNAVGGGAGGSSPIVAIDNLNGTGSANTIYDYNGRLYHWVSGAGQWGKWVVADYFESSYASINNQLTYLAYSYLPSSATLLCSLQFVTNSQYYSLSYDSTNEALLVYDSRNGTGNVLATIHKDGQETAMNYTGNNRKIYIKWEEGLITFRCDAYTQTDDRISTSVSEGHFEADDVVDFKGNNMNGSSGRGGFKIPAWNSEGSIYGTAMNVAVSSKKLNTTTYNNTINLLTDANRPGTSFQSWYIPTQGGTAGQVLTSAGDAEPTWKTMIKAVKITSDAYEALAVKDPNTLYLIDDE